MRLSNKVSILVIFITVLFFFKAFIFSGVLPIPSDTIVGLYHPFRDLYSKQYPNGIPFKNFLITDPVRQQFPWRELVIAIEKRLELPVWNPYSFSGTPLLGNMQSAYFYPPNVLFFLFPFNISWSILIILEPLLGGIFLYLYLNNLKLNKLASLLGGISFAFSGFFVAWMEWGTILHVALWLPLILLSIDKIVSSIKYQVLSIKNSKLLVWSFAYLFSLISSFFAGHLQTFFYLGTFSFVYFIARWLQHGKKGKVLTLYIILNTLYIILSSIQWIPTLQFILLSARDIDQASWQNSGWFIPWQHLIQFVAPDFFGNPTTLNYWGTWNYGELIGYVGILPLVMAIFALFSRRDKKTLFYGGIFFSSLTLSLPTILAKLPYVLNIPFLSSTQPTRLLFVTDFSLSVLSAFGFDYFVKYKKKEIFYPLVFIAIIFSLLWGFVLFGNNLINSISFENLPVAKNNLIFPSLIFFASAILIILFMVFQKTKISTLILCCIIVIVILELFRFYFKFTPFTNKEYLFPDTTAISFLQKQKGQFRIMTTDSRIFPPNFSTIYKIQSVDGYDPLYLRRYGELIAASERGQPNINPPFGFNRIITPHNYDSKIIDLLGVKYILSLSDLNLPKLKKVFQEGQTRVYENINAIPRAFFVDEVKIAKDKNEVIKIMFDKNFDPEKTAIVEDSLGVLSKPPLRWTKRKVEILAYSEDNMVIKTENVGDSFLVLTESFYPSWHAKIDGKETKIFRTDYNFRGINISGGKHVVEFYATLL